MRARGGADCASTVGWPCFNAGVYGRTGSGRNSVTLCRGVRKLLRYHVAMTTKVRRRLTTLRCADVEGYARLMGADEAGTLETLRRYRAAMATLIERHDGRVVNTWGDAVIAEFPSVVEAVQCAVETQQELSTYNGGLPEPRRMIFRIGIHLGDVMVEGDDVYGDGVNIAARLQERAEPGESLFPARSMIRCTTNYPLGSTASANST